MSKQSLLISFLLIVIILGGLGWYYNVDLSNLKNITNKQDSVVVKALDEKAIILPIAPNNPNVSATKVQYFVYGTIADIKTVSQGSEIFLANSKDIPSLVIKSGVRISKITPPYNLNPAIPLTVKDLKTGMVVDLSLQYDVVSQSWVLLDVFVSTDRNK